MTTKFKIKSGDLVQAISGKDKGKQGKVLKVISEESRVLVEGLNQVKKHSKPSQKNPQGGIEDKSLPIHISNVMLVDPSKGKVTRIGKKWIDGKKGEDGHWARVAKLSGQTLK